MSDQHVREQLVNALAKRQAHQSFDTAIEGFPPKHYNTRPPHTPYTFWHLLEHLRIAQADILDYIENPDYQYRKFPDDYWPAADALADSAIWQRTIDAFRANLAALSCHRARSERAISTRRSPTARAGTPFCGRSWLSPRTIPITSASSAYCAGTLNLW